MSEITPMEWDSDFSVDIEEIDDCQKNMMKLFNQLIALKGNKKDGKEIINMISEINEYSKLYFSTEEKILKKNGYPDFAVHSKSHRQFTKRSISLRRELSEDIGNLTDDVIDQLRQWLINHIREMDSQYVPYIRIKKYVETSNQKN